MPIHDWTRVRANRFHDFHQSWTVAICDALNAGRLPSGYFAMIERKAVTPEPDVIVVERNPPTSATWGGLSVERQPPKTRFVMRADAGSYARKANRLTVRHPDGDVVAILEIVSPGNKDSRHALRAFTRKAVEFLQAGVHLLIVDLFPPGPRDPQGIHKAIWDRIRDEPAGGDLPDGLGPVPGAAAGAAGGAADAPRSDYAGRGVTRMRRISSHSPGDTSLGWCSATDFSQSSGEPPNASVSAAAATAGERLMPAPQQSSVGVRSRTSAAVVSIASDNVEGRLPTPSNSGK